MQLDPILCAKARQSRDPRFDGQFFIGVLTTGIYCRPVCPANSPQEKNVRYFATAAAAAAAGLRPCLRCRPETAPGSPAWNGTSATVTRAIRLIEDGALDEHGVDTLADRLGIGSRHLRRLFAEHVGASPVEVAQTRRLHFAKRLIDETELPLSEVAFSAGYESLRRFHATFQSVYGRPPRELRREREEIPAQGDYRFRLQYRPPLAWEPLLDFFAARAIPGVESVEGPRYRRTIRLGGKCGWFSVEPLRDSGVPQHRASAIELRVQFPDARRLLEIIERVRRMLDLNADPVAIQAATAPTATLRERSPDHVALPWIPGLRLPGAWDGFEVAIRAILGQQVSVKGASTLAGRLVQSFGTATGDSWIFPDAATLAAAPVEQIGIPGARAESIRRLAAAVASGDLILDGRQPLEETAAKLNELPGIGPWTVEYIRMRALGDPDAFPSGDLVLQKQTGLSAAGLEKLAESWRPWRAYAAIAIWRAAAATPDTPPASTGGRHSTSAGMARGTK